MRRKLSKSNFYPKESLRSAGQLTLKCGIGFSFRNINPAALRAKVHDTGFWVSTSLGQNAWTGRKERPRERALQHIRQREIGGAVISWLCGNFSFTCCHPTQTDFNVNPTDTDADTETDKDTDTFADRDTDRWPRQRLIIGLLATHAQCPESKVASSSPSPKPKNRRPRPKRRPSRRYNMASM